MYINLCTFNLFLVYVCFVMSRTRLPNALMCMYMCICKGVFARVYACLYMFFCVYECLSMRVCAFACVCVRVCVCVCSFACVHTGFVNVCVVHKYKCQTR